MPVSILQQATQRNRGNRIKTWPNNVATHVADSP